MNIINMSLKKYIVIVTVLFLVIIMTLPNTGAVFTTPKPTPPDQPTSGPGGSNYKHNGVEKSSYKKGAERYWIFEPIDPKCEYH